MPPDEPSLRVLNDYRSLYSPQLLSGALFDAPVHIRRKFRVTSLIWYKGRNGVEHEFLVAHLTESRCLLIERCSDSDEKLSRVLLTSSPSSATPVSAEDSIRVIPSPDIGLFIIKKRADQLAKYEFQNISLFDIVRLVAIVSNNKPEYEVTGSMCYWFASTIVNVAIREWTPTASHPSSSNWKLGTLNGLPVHHHKEDQIMAIKAILHEEIAHTPDPVGPIETAFQKCGQRAQEEAERAQEGEQRAREEVRIGREEVRIGREREQRLQEQIQQMARQLQAFQRQQQAGHHTR